MKTGMIFQKYNRQMELTKNEMLQRVNERGEPVGVVGRNVAHNGSRLLHHVVHVLVFDHRKRLLLQKRSKHKDLGPGLWDISVGGHLRPGETPLEAAVRETAEELGIRTNRFEPLYEYIFRGARESEYVSTFRMIHEGPFAPDSREVESLRFTAFDEIQQTMESGMYTENFEAEIRRFREHRHAT